MKRTIFALVLATAVGCSTTRSTVSPPPLPASEPGKSETSAQELAESVRRIPCEKTLAGAQFAAKSSTLEKLDVVLARVSTNGWPEADEHLAVALCVFADALDDGKGSERAGTIEEHASLLAGTREASVGKCRHLRAGFDAVLTALERRHGAAKGGSAERAISVAKDAVGRVEPTGLIAFQRASIQDALRTLTTAYAHLQPAATAHRADSSVRAATAESRGK